MHPFAEMLGLADSLGEAPIVASDKRLLRQIIVPCADQQRQFGPRREPFVQRGWLGRRREGVVHRRDDRLSMFEVLDILRRRGQIIANLVRHGRRFCQVGDKRLRRRRQVRRPRERQHARTKIGNDLAALERRDYFFEHQSLLDPWTTPRMHYCSAAAFKASTSAAATR